MSATQTRRHDSRPGDDLSAAPAARPTGAARYSPMVSEPGTAVGQFRARPLTEPEDITPARNPGARPELTKEVFEMASSRFTEEESGTYISAPRHPHDGYYAGDFSNAPLTVPELRLVLPRHHVQAR